MKTSSTTYQTHNGYELSDLPIVIGISNTRVVLTDRRVSTYTSGFLTSVSTDISSWSDYFSFGWEIPGRHVDLPNSRYTFNGKELDREWDKLDFGARPYDRKRGQWNTPDPFESKYPNVSPYVFALNNPIAYIDEDGQDVTESNNFKKHSQLQAVLQTFSKTKSFNKLTKLYLADVMNLRFHMGSIKEDKLGQVTYANAGFTKFPGTQTIQFNLDRFTVLNSTTGKIRYYKKFKSPTLVAGMLVHEFLHSRKNLQMFILASDQVTVYNVEGEFVKQLGGWQQDFPGLADYYERYKDSDDHEWHHEWMADHGRGEIIEAMKQFDMENYGKEAHDAKWYKAISWLGLQRTDAWKDFQTKNPDLAKEYNDIINNELGSFDILTPAENKEELESSKKNTSG